MATAPKKDDLKAKFEAAAAAAKKTKKKPDDAITTYETQVDKLNRD